jgi:hypothetical protein
MKQWRKNNREYCLSFDRKRWKENPERIGYNISKAGRERDKRFKKSAKGRLNNIKCCNKRRALGFNIIIQNIIDEEIHWHHITDRDVIAIPKDIHELYNNGTDKEAHRENLIPIIEQLYPEIID